MAHTHSLELKPLSFPLSGSHLIEASAGTGKTWTIAALFVRLIIGHGGSTPRLPEQILVLTYTKAAAAELRDRIRARLAQVARVFAGDSSAQELAEDEFLRGLWAEYDEAARRALAPLLELAAQSMDQAAISTIHAWCARVLGEHAFDSGKSFDLQIEPDNSALRRQVAWDYWRNFVAGLARTDLDELLALWPEPDSLLGFSADLGRMPVFAPPQQDLGAVCAQWRAARAQRLQELKQLWQPKARALQQWLLGLDKPPGRPKNLREWTDAIIAWADDPQAVEPSLSSTAKKRLNAAGFAEFYGAQAAPSSPLLDEFEQLLAQLEALPDLLGFVQAHAMGWMQQRLHLLMQQAAQMGYDDLLLGLHQALADSSRLAAVLRAQYPVILIDEFQDTDPLQYAIFEQIYEVGANRPENLVVFIGDPKQSIYGFRGADVLTYLRAHQACAGRVHSLAVNYRSSAAMVAVSNAFFSDPGQTGQAPFITDPDSAALDFTRVTARGRPETLRVRGAPWAALQVDYIAGAQHGKPLGLGEFEQASAKLCAAQIANLLGLAASGEARWYQGDAPLAAVQERDIAILVATSAQAELMRAALAACGLRSVYLSEQGSVFGAAVAGEIALLLRACADPANEAMVRAALALPLLAQDDAVLLQLAVDELLWEQELERFGAYRQLWLRRGVLPLLRQILHDFAVPARLLGQAQEGERALVDYLHIAELLAQAAASLDGPQALLFYLQQQISGLGQSEQSKLRLESDEGLIRIVTIHKSKGLEYPLVYLPFVCRGRSGATSFKPRIVNSPAGPQWLMQADKEQIERLRLQDLGEEVRKLYVALTRARHAVWLAMGEVSHLASTGIGQALGTDLSSAWENLQATLGAAAAPAPQQLVEFAPLATEPGALKLQAARVLERPALAEHWWVASYSALQLGEPQAADSAREDQLIESKGLAAPEPDAPSDAPPEGPQLDALAPLGRGSALGSFIHGLLEWAAANKFSDLAGARDMIARRCAVRGWEHFIDHLHQWLEQFVAEQWRLPLPGAPRICLAQLEASLAEMEFWMPVHQLPTAKLDALLRRWIYPGAPRPALRADMLNGMFKGFIDLCMLADGRYYLADYKTNLLAGYDADNLQNAMLHARYDAQLALYLLALHRQLRACLADYDYRRHVGGAVYFFVRGQHASGQGLVAQLPEQEFIDELDALFEVSHGS